MRAINVIRYGEKLRVRKIKIPKPNENELLIKIKAAPINPSDIGYAYGLYGIKRPLPTTIGFEGCGVVYEIGKNLSQNFVNKNVSCWMDNQINSGTWGEYFLCKKDNFIEFDKLEHDMCSNFINPFTAIGFLEEIQQVNAEMVILTASSSQISQMVLKLLKQNNIKAVCIVRKQEQIQILQQKYNPEAVINSSSKNFQEELEEFLSQYQNIKQIFFDAVGDSVSAEIFKQMSKNSHMVVYGSLARKKMDNIDSREMYFSNKTIRGFWLNTMLENKNEEQFNDIKQQVRLNYENIFKSQIAKQYYLEEIEEAIKFQQQNQSLGKTILTP